MIELVRQYAQKHRLLRAGDRVAVAVSGGADSVALLRALAELRQELGIVLSVAHFHHGIRGAEADADREFVGGLAERFGLELHLGVGDSPAEARSRRVSLETAARDLRHAWFAQLISGNKADKVATAHTLDDQAETLLLRLIRGAGVRGLAGIFPLQREKHLIRPLLGVTRTDVESYLRSLGQTWREDSTNRDLTHTRNRVRHQLLPILEHDFNAGVRRTLADLAEIARSESEYWDQLTSDLMGKIGRQGKPSRSGRSASGKASQTLALDLPMLTALPEALERQLLHRVAAQLGSRLEFIHVQQLSELARQRRAGKRLVLPGGLIAVRSFRELQFTLMNQEDQREAGFGSYEYRLSVPGETRVPELGSVIHARLIEIGKEPANSYNSASLLTPALVGEELIVRNWRPGDKFFPARTRTPRKLKELLQTARVGRVIDADERKAWPVVESQGQIVWVRGFAVPEAYAAKGDSALLIVENRF